MKSSNAPTISRPKVIVGWLTIITQAALPLSFAYTPLVQAAAKEDETKWYQSGKNTPSIFEDNASSLAAAARRCRSAILEEQQKVLRDLPPPAR